MILITILLAWLLADFLTGVVHWFEDAYLSGEYSLDFLQSINDENKLHHDKPTAMLVNSGWTNIRTAAVIGWPLSLLLWFVGCPAIVWLTIFFSTFGNLVHRWAHAPARQLPQAIRFMQYTGLFITRAHHDSHHRSMKSLIPKHLAGWKFCPMTNWVNPIVDAVHLWRGLEFVLARCGLKPTRDRKQQTNTL